MFRVSSLSYKLPLNSYQGQLESKAVLDWTLLCHDIDCHDFLAESSFPHGRLDVKNPFVLIDLSVMVLA